MGKKGHHVDASFRREKGGAATYLSSNTLRKPSLAIEYMSSDCHVSEDGAERQ